MASFQGFDGNLYPVHAIRRGARGIWRVWYYVPALGEMIAYLTTAQKNARVSE